MSYRDVILDQLVARNSREHVFHEMVVASKHIALYSPMTPIVFSCILNAPLPSPDQKLLNRLVDLQRNNTRLEAKVKKVQVQNDTLSRAAEYAQVQG